MQKFIFDLDGTLMHCDYKSAEGKYFASLLGEEAARGFVPRIPKLLNKYEYSYEKYEVNKLSQFLTMETGIDITNDYIEGWIDLFDGVYTEVDKDVLETLEYLKHKDKKTVILTNWFTASQLPKIRNSEISGYIDEIYGGDMILKPRKEAFLNACGYTPKEECIMIGDNYDKDYLGAKYAGLNALHFTDKDDIKNGKIKTLSKIKELY